MIVPASLRILALLGKKYSYGGDRWRWDWIYVLGFLWGDARLPGCVVFTVHRTSLQSQDIITFYLMKRDFREANPSKPAGFRPVFDFPRRSLNFDRCRKLEASLIGCRRWHARRHFSYTNGILWSVTLLQVGNKLKAEPPSRGTEHNRNLTQTVLPLPKVPAALTHPCN